MATADRTPIILACVADILGERAGTDDHWPTMHRLLADVVSDPVAVARLWPPTSGDQLDAHHIVDVLYGDRSDRPVIRNQAANVAAVAAHLAAAAAALHVRGEDAAEDARTLWRAASRLLGHDYDRDASVHTAEALERDEARNALAYAEHDLKLARDEADELRCELEAALGMQRRLGDALPVVLRDAITALERIASQVGVELSSPSLDTLGAAITVQIVALTGFRDHVLHALELSERSDLGGVVGLIRETRRDRASYLEALTILGCTGADSEDAPRWARHRRKAEKDTAIEERGINDARAAEQRLANAEADLALARNDIDFLRTRDTKEIARLTNELATARADLDEARQVVAGIRFGDDSPIRERDRLAVRYEALEARFEQERQRLIAVTADARQVGLLADVDIIRRALSVYRRIEQGARFGLTPDGCVAEIDSSEDVEVKREVGASKCRHRMDGDAAACDHCSLKPAC